MRRLRLFASIVLLSLQTLTSVHADSTARLYVSRTGDDSGSCLQSAPCKSLQTAINKTPINGIINCIDPTESGGNVTISTPITIDCEGTLLTNFNVTVNTGSTTPVLLR